MSTYVLMRILESAPGRYDLGLRLLTLGRLERSYARLTEGIEAGQRVLDIGCGTGALTILAARQGATVKGIDISSRMLEIARQRVERADPAGTVLLEEMGLAELDGEEPDSYDVVMSGLCFSELSADEITYTLKEIRRILKPEGRLLIADEARPASWLGRTLHWTLRAPLLILTYLLTQTTTRAVADLPGKVTRAGLELEEVRFNRTGSFLELVGRKPEKD